MVKPIGKLSDKIYAEVTESLQRRLSERRACAKREQASIALTNPWLLGGESVQIRCPTNVQVKTSVTKAPGVKDVM